MVKNERAKAVQQIKDILHFNGKWRSYQKRVLDKSAQYLADKRMHIVAAPGSGKTTLGIELIRRLNAPALILSPSINIRDQWLARIREAYIPEGTETEGLLSNSIKEPGAITAITYQALHSGMTKKKGKEAESGTAEEAAESGTEELPEEAAQKDSVAEKTMEGNALNEDTDYSDFDFFATVKGNGIRTICLDEAHHLRSEWWKALEEMVKKLPECTVISLTATPPYDSTLAQWERYIGLCGPIDEEIIVPELVKEGSLCPHQDYVYFNMPTRDEEEAVKKFAAEAARKADELFGDKEFADIISTHKGILAPKTCADLFLEKPEYLSALLIFLQAKNIAFSGELLRMTGKGRLPSITLKWMEILLQGFLYEDTESYNCTREYRENMIGSLKARGLIQKNTVCLAKNDAINKLLMNSKGKLNSILEVTRAEYENMGSDLRLLILTDYIKKEYMQAVGNLEKRVDELGVIPIFENIRRAFSGIKSEKNTTSSGERITAGNLRMGVLSGSVVIIPASAKAALQEIMNERMVKGSMKELTEGSYYQVTISGTEHTASSLVTELFNRGEVRVLIGTKSLLGEGWDSPCINSLILASFVGSFMLSNQMRGRAIRVMRDNPDKVSNIWHLICMQPESVQEVTTAGSTEVLLKEEAETEDFATLRRRFDGFLGVHYEKNSIESGLQRLSCIKGPYTGAMLEKINGQMLCMAADRKALKKKWEDCLAPLTKMEAVIEAGVAKEFFKKDFRFYKTVAEAVLVGIAFIFSMTKFFQVLGAAGSKGFFHAFAMVFWGMCSSFTGVFMGKRLVYLWRTAAPCRYMQAVGNCMLAALRKFGPIQSHDVKTAIDEIGEDDMNFIYLRGGSEREKDVFAKCVCEFFGVVDKQRYLLEAQYSVSKLCRYYCVPELFGKRKEDALLFQGKVKRYIGSYALHYTRSQEGKQLMLAAKLYSLANKNPACVAKKKVIRNAE